MQDPFIALIDDPAVVRQILSHLGRWQPDALLRLRHCLCEPEQVCGRYRYCRRLAPSLNASLQLVLLDSSATYNTGAEKPRFEFFNEIVNFLKEQP